jgi:hypothetical protein
VPELTGTVQQAWDAREGWIAWWIEAAQALIFSGMFKPSDILQDIAWIGNIEKAL